MQKKKIINFRPAFYAFISLVFALLISRRFLLGQLPYVIFFVIALVSIIVIASIRKSFVPAIICLCFIGFGVGGYLISVNSFNNARDYTQPQQVTGQVISVRNYASSQSVILGNTDLENGNNYNISVYILGGDVLLGEKITFTANLEKSKLFNLGTFSSYIYNNKIFYLTQIQEQDITHKTTAKLSLRDKIKSNTLKSFLSAMPEESAYIAYGAMFGDSDKIDKDIYTWFADSGIIHILSVSGMHIAFVVAILNFFISKTKLNKKLRFAFFAVALFFYSYLCSFNATVVRSALMSLILIFGTSFGKRYDMLTAIGLSGLVLLMFKPLSVFDIGFQLSYLSIFMISAFSKPISGFLNKIGLPKVISTSLALSISVQAGLFPLCLKYFGQFPFVSIFSNLLIVPIFELAFVLVFTLNILLFLLPFLSFFLIPTSLLIKAVVWLSALFSSFSNFMLYGNVASSIAILLFLLIIFLFSSFVMLKTKHKAVVISIVSVLTMLFALVENAPLNYSNLTVFQVNNFNATSTIFYAQNEFLLISDFKDVHYIVNFAATAKIKNFDVVVLAENYNKENLAAFKEVYSKSVYLENGKDFKGNVFAISHLTIYNNKKIPVIEVYGYKNLVLTTTLSQSQHEQLDIATRQAEINALISWKEDFNDFNCDYLIYSKALQSKNISADKLNNWFFELEHDTIKFVRSLD